MLWQSIKDDWGSDKLRLVMAGHEQVHNVL